MRQSNVHFERSKVLFRQGKYDLAEREVRQEIAINPDFADAYALLGLCLINQIKFTPDIQIGEVFNRFQANKQKSLAALAAIQSAIQLDPIDARFHSILATYWYCEKNYDRAKTAIEEAIRLNPNSADHFYLLACILSDKGEQAYQIANTGSRGTLFLVERWLLKYYLKDAFPPIKKSLSIDPNYLPALNLYTILLTKTGETKAALVNSIQALLIDAGDPVAHKNHGLLLIENGKYSAAVNSFQTALQIDPNLIAAREGLLEALRSQYPLYRYLNLNQSCGKLVFISVFPVMCIAVLVVRQLMTGSVNIKTPPELLVYAIGLTIIVIAFPAQWIFNYPLQFDRIGKSILSKQDLIIASSVSAITFTALFAIYASMFFNDTPSRTLAMHLTATIGGLVVPAVNLPYLKNNPAKHLYVGGTVVIWLLGIFNLICLVFQQTAILNIIGFIYTFIVLFSPLIAMRIDREGRF